MGAVACPRPDPGPRIPWMVLVGTFLASVVPGSRAYGQDAAHAGVLLNRVEVERLLAIDRPPVSLAVIGASRIVRVPPDAADIRLGPDEYLAVRLSGSPETVNRAGDRLRLPIRYVRLGEPGLHLVAAVELEEGGLRYAVQQGSEGAFLIGLQDTVQPEVRRPLSPPIRLRLSVHNGTVEPNAVELTHTNIPFTRVVVRTLTPSESVAVRVRPEFDDRGVAVGLPVRPPAVSVTTSSHRILGFGFESVRIRFTAPIGVLPGAVRALVTVDGGTAEPASLVLGHDGVAVVSLRSQGLGTATVTVTGPSMLGTTTMVEFVWPVTLLISAMLGAAFGIAVTFIRARLVGRRPPLPAWRGQLVAGLAVGTGSAVVLGLVANGTTVEIPIRVAEATVLVMAGMGACIAPAASRRFDGGWGRCRRPPGRSVIQPTTRSRIWLG